jgi:hypothetical protein
MHDPVQDRLMVRRMSYFRMKKLTLGRQYEAFLDRTLEPGGTIFLVDCRLSWPVTGCGDRHLFQFGALGGATVEEMHRGGPRVADYLKRYGSSRTQWDPPAPDALAPEAEWGFDQALGDEVLRLGNEPRPLRRGLDIGRAGIVSDRPLVRRFRRFQRNTICRLALRFPLLVRWLHTPHPVLTQHYEYAGASPVRDLLVLLPDIGDSAEDFERQGFVDLVHNMDWAVDMVMVDAHYGYYADRTVFRELHEEVFRPAKARSYRKIWLAGISLGGFGALLYASRYTNDVTGVFAMAPFLGSRPLIEEISGAGGLSQWTAEEAREEDYERSLWQWLRRSLNQPSGPICYLGFGDHDTFIPAQRLLAASLRQERVFIEPGGHSWPTWTRLWKRFLRDAPRDVGHAGAEC